MGRFYGLYSPSTQFRQDNMSKKKIDKLYCKGDWDGVIGVAGELFDDFEEDVCILNDLAVAYNKKEMYDEAFKVCKRIYELNPEPDMAKQTLEIGSRYMRHHLIMGECYYQKGMHKEALQVFKRLKALGSQFSEKYIYAARVHLDEARPVDAIGELKEMTEQTKKRRDSVKEALNDVIKKFPMCEKAYDFMHDLLSSEGKLEERVEELEKVVDNGDETEPMDIYVLGNLLRCSGHADKSIKLFRNVIKAHSKDPGVVYFYASSKIASGAVKDGMQVFTALLKKSKKLLPAIIDKMEETAGPNCDDTFIFKSLAGLYLAAGDVKKGVATLELLVKSHPENAKLKTKLAEGLIKLINSYIKDGAVNEACEKLERLVKLMPEKPEFAKKLKHLRDQEEKRRMDEYEAQLNQGALDDAEANQIRLKLVEYYKKTGADENKRVSMFQKIAKTGGEFQPEAAFNIGVSFLSKGLADLAYDNFIKIAESKIPDDKKLEMLYSIGETYQEKEDYEKADEFYKKILSIDMEYKDIAEKLAEVSDNLGKSPAEKKEAGSLEDSYDDIKKIGEGGMGAIYRATHKVLGRTVALKVIRSEFTADEEALARFIREAQSASALQHAGITTIYDISVSEPVYIAMELVEGGNLLEKLDGKMMDIQEFLSTAIDICEALDAAHEKGIVHRDIKLENIMLTKEGKIKIADFGLASITTSPRMTQAGQVMGTPLYMPPEQIKGLPTDNRSDIYALGITFYEMLTGNVPFSEGDIGYQHIHETPESPSFINPEINEQLEAAILKCIEKKPEDRYQKVGDLTEDLKKV